MSLDHAVSPSSLVLPCLTSRPSRVHGGGFGLYSSSTITSGTVIGLLPGPLLLTDRNHFTPHQDTLHTFCTSATVFKPSIHITTVAPHPPLTCTSTTCHPNPVCPTKTTLIVIVAVSVSLVSAGVYTGRLRRRSARPIPSWSTHCAMAADPSNQYVLLAQPGTSLLTYVNEPGICMQVYLGNMSAPYTHPSPTAYSLACLPLNPCMALRA